MSNYKSFEEVKRVLTFGFTDEDEKDYSPDKFAKYPHPRFVRDLMRLRQMIDLHIDDLSKKEKIDKEEVIEILRTVRNTLYPNPVKYDSDEF